MTTSVDSSVPGTGSLLQNLVDHGIISKRVFSFYLTNYNDWAKEPAFTLGGYDLDQFAPNQTLTWNPIYGTDYWTVLLSGAKFGTTDIPLTSTYAIVDTGTSYMAIPDNELLAIVSA